MLEVVPSSPQVLLLVVVLLFVAARLLFTGKDKRPPLPPGPRPLPLLGNALDFPKSHLGREFRSLSEKYGDVAYLSVLGQSIILVNSYDAACELLEKRSGNYSDRPQSAMVKMTNLDWIFVFKDYGAEWRRYRRELHVSFVPEMMTRYFAIQRQYTRGLLRNLLDTPADFSAHIKFSFAAVVLRIVYGLDPEQGERKYYKLVERLATIAEDISTPGRHIVEAFPSMQRLPSWFPGTGFMQLAATWKAEIASIRDYLYDSAKETMGTSGVKESIITRLTEERVEDELSRNVTATIYAAGSDTTNAAVHAFVLAMAMFPEAQRKAQAELDAVVGPDRLPDFADQKSLPYVSALMKEVLRWHVVAPIGVPHRSTEADEYGGYYLPGGSLIIVNQWAMSRDPAYFPDPENFYPERFLLNGQLNPAIRDPAKFVFGFGRRICPGLHFAEAALFLNCAYILHTLNITPPLDLHGNPKKLEMKTNSLAVSHLLPFECRILARNAHMKELVRGNSA
ncbi:cytochrome P450 [Trametes versicolor FP-101664 SS1]|uniref:cytochrome P450 n=1 Tax=Trametes versicolor (strain FP-101664) TaxID=717944 RepID=UPI00046233DD|nr:cytochrome P450 [Trametes versicolor FP-101664 SS1]EIW58796.1 cytochrome P450 [Trametes versicolor FP-101664 SS1]